MKRNIIEIIIGLIIIAGIVFTIYDSSKLDETIFENKRKIDSLNVELEKYRHKYDSLSTVIKGLDSTISKQESRLNDTKNSFSSYQSPRLKNSNEAVKYIRNFIGE